MSTLEQQLKTEIFTFEHGQVKFKAKVAYTPTIDFPKSWHVQLLEPVELDCGGKPSPRSFSSGLALRGIKYTFNPDGIDPDENTLNIYNSAIDHILYIYFNKNESIKYTRIVRDLSAELDKQKEPELDAVRACKRELKRRLKSGSLDNHAYQRLLTPTQKLLDSLKFEICNIKDEYRGRYFECGRLKAQYRVNQLQPPETEL